MEFTVEQKAIIEKLVTEDSPTSLEDADDMLVDFEELKETEWFKERPKVIKDLIRKVPSDTVYFMESSKHFCRIYSYHEDGTLTVVVLHVDNPGHLAFERRVFGINPNELTRMKILKDEEGKQLFHPDTVIEEK